MSTDDERPDEPAVPRTRAELRAAREAEAAAAAEATPGTDADTVDGAPPEPVVESAPVEPAPVTPSPADDETPEPAITKPPPEPEYTPKAKKRPTAPRDRRFLLALGAVLGILVLVGAGLGVVSLTQGPRITEVQVNPAEAIEASGSRVILTANHSLAAIDEPQDPYEY